MKRSQSPEVKKIPLRNGDVYYGAWESRLEMVGFMLQLNGPLIRTVFIHRCRCTLVRLIVREYTLLPSFLSLQGRAAMVGRTPATTRANGRWVLQYATWADVWQAQCFHPVLAFPPPLSSEDHGLREGPHVSMHIVQLYWGL